MKPTNIRWRVFALLAAASFVSYFLRSNLSIVAPQMMEDLQLTELQWGQVMAAFIAGYTLFQFPGGIFADKKGPRLALTLIAVFWTLSTILIIVVPGPDSFSVSVILGSLLVIRFLTGVTHAPIFPLMNTGISRWFPAGAWALPSGLGSTGLTLGYAAAAPILVWLTLEYGWRTAFVIVSPLGAMVAAAWWWYARDYPHDHASVNEAEVDLIETDRAAPVLTPINPPGWLRLLKNRDILFLTIAYTGSNFVFYSAFSWFPYYLVKVRAFDPQVGAWVTSSQWIAGAAGAAIGGWLCDWLCKRVGIRKGCRWPIVFSLLTAGVALVVGAFTASAYAAAAMLGLCFFFHQLSEGAYWSSSIGIGGQLAGAAGGIMNTGANVMGIVNAMLVPLFAQFFGWPFAIASGAGFLLLSSVLVCFVRADKPVSLN